MKKETILLIAIAFILIVIMSTAKAKAKMIPAAVREEFNLFGTIIEEMSLRYGVPQERIAAIILVESMNDALAVGSAGERGLMQIKQGALADVNRNYALTYSFSDLFSMRANIEVGTAYLKLCYRWTGRTSWNYATQAYNAGIGNWMEDNTAGTAYLQRVLDKESAVKLFLASNVSENI